MMTNDLWKHIAETCNELYGSHVDEEERFLIVLIAANLFINVIGQM